MGVSRAEVYWAYRSYLGRLPESEEVVEAHCKAADAHRLNTTFRRSPEALAKGWIPTARTHFCIWRPERPKIIVVSNCQGPNLARILAMLTEYSVFGFEIQSYEANKDAFLPLWQSADYLLTFNTSAEWSDIQTETFLPRFGRKAVTHMPFYFSGLHPDMTYLGARGARLEAAAGESHSIPIVQSFLQGKSTEECMSVYEAFFHDIGNVQSVYRRSLDELYRREEMVDIKVADWFVTHCKDEHILYSSNHPSAAIMLKTCIEACRHWELKPNEIKHYQIQNTLMLDIVWPIHENVARMFALPYHSDQWWHSGSVIDRREFIERSYLRYENFGAERVFEAARERGLVQSNGVGSSASDPPPPALARGRSA